MIRKLLFMFLLIALSACATVRVPGPYIKDLHPYSERFYAGFEETLAAVEAALTAQGWILEQEADPSVYERWQETDLYESQILLITQGREHDGMVGKGMARLNIYIRSRRDISEVELRVVAVTSYRIKGVTRYHDDETAKVVFDQLHKLLPQAEPAP